MPARITIVNDKDEIIGYKARETLAKEDVYRVTALWVTNPSGDILLAQRKFTKVHDPGMWGPAVAGTVDEGETYMANIIKETEEEIGLANTKPNRGPKQRVNGEHNFFCQWFLLTIDKPAKDFVIQESEVEQVRWISSSKFRQELREHPEEYLGMIWPLNAFS